MSIKEIFCQDKAVGILQRAFAADKVPHAYIFAGAEGVGKFKTAREWAKLLLCEKPVTEKDYSDSCQFCESCRLVEAGSHPDFNHIYKELVQFTEKGKGKTTPVDMPIDVIREFLIAKVSTRPTVSGRKVFIVNEAERLNASSQNALLKVLEEPPEYCCIILLCTRLEKLLPTTKSRCQIVRFSPVEETRIIDKLKEIGLGKIQAQFFARLAQGSLGRACEWAQLELSGAKLYDAKKEIVQSLTRCNLPDALELAQRLCDKTRAIAAIWSDINKNISKTDVNRRTAKTLIQIIISALHDAMTLNLMGAEKIINFDQNEQIQILAERFEPEQTAREIDNACRTMQRIDSSVNEKLIFEQLLLNFADSDRISL